MSIATRFMTLATLAVTCGMAWGIVMSVRQDHLLAPAHAHLNLVGWVTLALFAVYYRLTPDAASRRLAEAHFWVATAGLVTLAPGIALAILGKGEALAAIGSILTLGSMLMFLWTVLRFGFGRTERPAARAGSRLPAA